MHRRRGQTVHLIFELKSESKREEYRVGPIFGVGNFGIAYRLNDEHLNTAAAIKEYYPRQIATLDEVRPYSDRETEEVEDGLQQFMEEGRTVARFDPPSPDRRRRVYQPQRERRVGAPTSSAT